MLGLTGGIASGKSSVLSLLQGMGWRTHSADQIVKDLLANDLQVIEEVDGNFGGGLLLAEGGINRPELAARVFADSSQLEALEKILHPRVRQCWQEAVLAENTAFWVIEIPLLFEKKLEKQFDFTVTVSTLPNIQRRRLRQNKKDLVSIEPRIQLQLTNSVKNHAADFVLSNLGSHYFLEKQVKALSAYLHSIS